MSNEKKIIKEMVQGNLKVNRKRNLLLVLAITLTTILFTSVLEIGFGGMQSIQETQLRLSGLKADVIWKIRKKMGHDIIETLVNVGYRLKKL